MISDPSIQNIITAFNGPKIRYNAIAIKCPYLLRNPSNLNRILVEIYLALEKVQVNREMLVEALFQFKNLWSSPDRQSRNQP